jgi:hypothetical protein
MIRNMSAILSPRSLCDLESDQADPLESGPTVLTCTLRAVLEVIQAAVVHPIDDLRLRPYSFERILIPRFVRAISGIRTRKRFRVGLNRHHRR